VAAHVAISARQGNGRVQTVELLGPAGAGKSTLAKLLCRRQPSLRLRLTAWDLSPRMLATCGLRELPLLARVGRPPQEVHFRCFLDLTRIVALCARLEHDDLRQYRAVLLDEGPIFLLTRMLAYQADGLQSVAARERWRQALRHCAASVDQIFWVDAPDHMLADRIRRRVKGHQLKNGTDAEISDFAAKYRAAFFEVSTLFAEHGGPQVTCFPASEPLPRLAERMTNALRASHVG
jgi:thymidylate kinase